MVHKPGGDFKDGKTYRAVATVWHKKRESRFDPAHVTRVCPNRWQSAKLALTS
jgi:hypothetical protein